MLIQFLNIHFVKTAYNLYLESSINVWLIIKTNPSLTLIENNFQIKYIERLRGVLKTGSARNEDQI